ncbi:MAG: protein kinase domain-containing protein [Armatimonadota bacterium]
MNCPICQTANPPDAQLCAACAAPLAAGGAAPRSHILPPGTRLQNGLFTVGKLLGQGGFGITYQGSATSKGRPVALKEFFPQGSVRHGLRVIPAGGMLESDFESARQRFLEEARLLERFQHPSIVDVYATFEENDTAYMAMELLRGKTLGAFLETRPTMEEAEAVACIRKAGEALAAVHAEGLLHRDLKPDNLMLTDDGRVVLIDFGTAREFAAERTHRMTAMLTPGYAPLEQYSQQGRFGPYTDIYALGATLYHLLTGVMPVSALDRVQGVELPSPAKLNPRVRRPVSDAVMWALEISVKDRPQSVGAFLAALSGQAAAPRSPRAGLPPAAPLRFSAGEARSLPELLELCERYPNEAANLLYEGRIERWIRSSLSDAALAARVRALVTTHARDRRRGVELFTRELLRASGKEASLRLVPQEPALDLGTVPAGGKTIAAVPLRAEGRPHAWGTVEVDRTLPGMVAPPRFEVVDGGGRIELGLDTGDADPGEHRGVVRFQPEGGAPVAVPVSYRVEPLRAKVEPERLELGRLAPGESVSAAVTLTADPPEGRLRARVDLDPPVPGARVTPQVRGNPAQVSFSLDPRALEPGRKYETQIVVEGNAGKLSVPVRFSLGTDWGLVARATAAGGLWTSAALGLARLAIGAASPERWILSPELSLGFLLVAAPLGLLALIRLGTLLGRVRRSGPQRETPPVGCLGIVWRAAAVAAALLAAPLLGPAWLAGLDLAGQGWRALGLGPAPAWALNGAVLGLVHGLGAGLLKAGRLGPGRAVLWLGILLLVALLPLGWWGAPWIAQLFGVPPSPGG